MKLQLLLLLLTLPLCAAEPQPVLTLPVKVHLLQSATQTNLHTTLTESDVERIFGKVNRVWSQAGIRFEVKVVVKTTAREPAAGAVYERYYDRVKAAVPKESLSPTAIDVCYVKHIADNGFYYGEPAIVKDTAALTNVVGGMDEPIPRVTSHELGHALGLVHRQNRTNLMASKMSGFSLNEAEILIARTKAAAFLSRTNEQPK